jgi:hypothetical protein
MVPWHGKEHFVFKDALPGAFRLQLALTGAASPALRYASMMPNKHPEYLQRAEA